MFTGRRWDFEEGSGLYYYRLRYYAQEESQRAAPEVPQRHRGYAKRRIAARQAERVGCGETSRSLERQVEQTSVSEVLPAALRQAGPAPDVIVRIRSRSPSRSRGAAATGWRIARFGAALVALAAGASGCATTASPRPPVSEHPRGGGVPAANGEERRVQAGVATDQSRPADVQVARALDGRWRSALALFRKRKYFQAKEEFSRILELDPRSRSALQYRAMCSLEIGRPLEARKDLTVALAGASGRERARVLGLRAEAWQALTDLRAMHADYVESLAVARTPETLISRGQFFLETGDYDRALADFTAAIESEPERESQCTALLGRSKTWRELERFDEAERDADSVVALDPDRASGWAQRGLVRFDKAMWRAAARDFAEAVARMPRSDPFSAHLQRLAERSLELDGRQSD